MNGTTVQVAYNPINEEEFRQNGEIHVLIEGHEEAEKFLEALEGLGGNAGVVIEELLQTIYELGIEQGKKLERAKPPVIQNHSPSLSLKMRR